MRYGPRRAALADELAKWSPLDGIYAAEQRAVSQYVKQVYLLHKMRSQALQALARANQANFVECYNAFVNYMGRGNEAGRAADEFAKGEAATKQ